MTSDDSRTSRLEELLRTIEKLPPLRGITFRGCPSDAQFVRDGQSVVAGGLVSSSRNLDVATEGRSAPGVYAIMSRSGRDISPFSARREENEVVFLPGTLFFLAGTRRLGGLDVRMVFELDPQQGELRLPDELVPRFAEELERYVTAWAGRPVSPVEQIPGKFCGDIV